MGLVNRFLIATGLSKPRRWVRSRRVLDHEMPHLQRRIVEELGPELGMLKIKHVGAFVREQEAIEQGKIKGRVLRSREDFLRSKHGKAFAQSANVLRDRALSTILEGRALPKGIGEYRFEQRIFRGTPLENLGPGKQLFIRVDEFMRLKNLERFHGSEELKQKEAAELRRQIESFGLKRRVARKLSLSKGASPGVQHALDVLTREPPKIPSVVNEHKIEPPPRRKPLRARKIPIHKGRPRGV